MAKKKEAPLVSEYELAPTKDLVGKVKTFTTWMQSDEADDHFDEMDVFIKGFEKSYVAAKRGVNEKTKKPKSYKIANDVEAQEYINNLALHMIKADHLKGGDAAVALYAAHPEHIRTYLESKGINYKQLVEDLSGSSKKTRKASKAYQQFVEFVKIYSHPTASDGQKAQQVLHEASVGSDRHGQLITIVNNETQKLGYQAKTNLKSVDALKQLSHHWTEEFSPKYLEGQSKHFKKYKK